MTKSFDESRNGMDPDQPTTASDGHGGLADIPSVDRPTEALARKITEARTANKKAKPSTFEELCGYLADEGGGYTLWIGAGASIAATRGACPGWTDLISNLALEAERHGVLRPGSWVGMDMPDRLEWISGSLSHGAFRRRLRNLLVDPIQVGTLNLDVLLDQAIIGSRASNIVSFNIEMTTSISFAMGQGGAFIARTYLPSGQYTAATLQPKAGTIGNTVYFPHGLLDTQGNCVMTRSEYDLHGASLAAGAAVSLCLGGDLLVLGMSLSDKYLRDAILRGRQWIRDIYWVADSFPHAEWARVARVVCVPAANTEVWASLAKAAMAADGRGELVRNRAILEKMLPTAERELITAVQGMPLYLEELAKTVVSAAHAGTAVLEQLADHCIDLGLEVPAVVLADPRWRRGRT